MDDKNAQKKLDDLPKDKTTVLHTLYQAVTCSFKEHMFEMTDGTTVECRKCHSGFYLTPGSEVKEGHIYMHGELVI